MNTLISILIMILIFGTPIFLIVQNMEQNEIKKLNKKIKQIEEEIDILTKDLYIINSQKNAIQKELHDKLNK
jgi:hypothetical protein